MDFDAQVATLRSAIRDVPDFPKPGIVFKDITTLLGTRCSSAARSTCSPSCAETWRPTRSSRSRAGASSWAARWRFGSVRASCPCASRGSCPWKARQASYELEYGKDTLEIHDDALRAGERVLVVDDVIATGGTAGAVAELTGSFGATLVGFGFLVELGFLNGRAKLAGHEIRSLIHY